MTPTTTYYDIDKNEYKTYKWSMPPLVKILVKKNGKPHQVVRFHKLSGKPVPSYYNS